MRGPDCIVVAAVATLFHVLVKCFEQCDALYVSVFTVRKQPLDKSPRGLNWPSQVQQMKALGGAL